MNAKIAIAIASALASSVSFATNTPYGDCVGQQACMTTNNHPVANGGSSNARQDQSQNQDQHQHQNQAQSVSSSGGRVDASFTPQVSNIDNSRYESRYINPIQPSQPMIVTPSADVSRFAGDCGPRMQIVGKDVQGRYYGAITTDTFVAGEDMQLVPDDQPYRKYEIVPGVVQLIGHRVVETSAVTTVSGGRSIGIGLATSNHSGSGAAGGAGAMQRLVTTIRLQECVAYEINTIKPRRIRG